MRPIADNERICPMCGRLAFEGVTHPRCRTRYSLDGLTSFFHYDGVVRKAVKAIKYRLVSDLAEEFISLTRIPTYRRDDRVLVPIPLHPARLRDRGFNQAEVLGNILAKRLNIPARTDILQRVKETEPQASIKKRADRLENMRNIFSCKNVSGNILLFDDVCTSGATMRSAAAVLKRAGATSVWAISMAR
jgi:ComF family protein